MSERISFASRTGEAIQGAIARPSQRRAGAVIVVHEWWGLTQQIERTVDRLAAAGFLALAPDLYRGEVVPYTSSARAEELMTGLDGERAVADLGGALDYLKGHEAGNGKVGITGFCMGGALTFRAACFLPGLSAAAPFYGLPANPDWSRVTVPIEAHFSATDQWAKPAAAEKIQNTLAARGQRMDLHVYAAEHAFMNDARPEVYDAASAELAWGRLVAFLTAHLS